MRRTWLPLLLPLTLALACGDKDAGDSGDIDADGDGVSALEDCDDDDAAAFPGNTETCDGVDNDCDGVIDNDVKLTFYADADGDGFGDANDAEEGCTPWGEYIEDNTDCDDSSDAIYPGAPEDDCTDPVDYNCDGSVQYADADGDGHAACVDCDDNNSTINPDAVEECDYLDNNCDGTVDESGSTAGTYYADTDEDGYGDAANSVEACHEAPSGYVEDMTDCDDADANTYPGAAEICDAADNDCDGAVGEALVPTDYASIQEGVDAGEPWVCIEAGTYTEAVWIDTSTDLTIEGVGSADVTLDGSGTDRVIDALTSGGATLTLGGLTVTGGYAADGYAGGVNVEDDGTGIVVVYDAVFTDNTCDFSDCFGSALTVQSADQAELWDVTSHGNTLAGAGYGTLSLYGVTHFTADGLEIYDENESHSQNGGWSNGLLAWGDGTGDASFNDTAVYENSVDAVGSYSPLVIYSYLNVDVSHTDVYSNTVVGSEYCVGSSLFLYSNQYATVTNSTVVGNTCESTNAVYAAGPWSLAVSFDGNPSSLDVTNVIVAGNTSSGVQDYGGILFDYHANGDGTSTWTNVSVHGNSVTADSSLGAGWSLYGGATTLTNVDYSGNSFDVDSYDDATGFGFFDQDNDSTYTFLYNNLADLGDVAFASTVTDPTGTDGNISSDPGYADVTSTDPTAWDLTLATGSALIDAGDPSLLDTDDTTSDIGAYGGPDADL